MRKHNNCSTGQNSNSAKRKKNNKKNQKNQHLNLSQKLRQRANEERQIALRKQRSFFVGALRYCRGRQPESTFRMIAMQCIQAAIKHSTLSGKPYIGSDKPSDVLIDQCFGNSWTLSPDLSLAAYDYLIEIGYGGNIDDLWLSLYGRRKPTTRNTNGRYTSRDKLQSQDGLIANHTPLHSNWIVFINTGTTRKLGSHKST